MKKRIAANRKVVSISSKKNASLKKRFERYTGENHIEKLEWGKAQGKEIW